jgi:hypothetical protein
LTAGFYWLAFGYNAIMNKPRVSKPKLTIIEGGRDALEKALACALFGPDKTEIDRCVDRLNQIASKTPSLKLHANLSPLPNKRLFLNFLP